MKAVSFRSNKYDLAVNTISEEDLKELTEWLNAYPKLTMGNETMAFEKAWAKWLGVKYAVMCNSGASANLLMYAALDATKRSGKRKVVVPATGWPTDIAPAIQFGWQPFMCESDRRTFGLDPEFLEKLLKKHHPETVVLVQVLGVPADMDAIMSLKKKYEFNLLEDCCASHGAKYKGKKVGLFGDISVFSFYYGHHMSTVEGGVLCTNDVELYHALLMLRSHGWLRDIPKTKANKIMKKYGVDPFHSPFTFVLPGFNLRPTEISAHMGLIQLKKLNDTVDIRIANHKMYQKCLEGVLEFAPGIDGSVISSISFCAVAKEVQHRKRIVKNLIKHKIDTRIFSAGNLGRHPFWFERYGVFKAPLADKLYSGGFFLPNNQSLTTEDVKWISEIVKKS